MRHLRAWPADPLPSKAEIEGMYKIAYYVDPAVFKPEDVVDFGLDLHRLKEFGEVRMKKPLRRLRQHVRDLWDRMDRDQRCLFLMSHLASGLKYASSVLDDLERVLGPLEAERASLDQAMNLVYGRLPVGLMRRIRQGLGKEWLNGAT